MTSDIYTYFQNFNTEKTSNGMEYFCNSIGKKNVDGINLDKIDDFFTTIGDIYANIIENGLVPVDCDNIVFESKHTTKFFITGLKCLKNAVIDLNIDIILEFLLDLEHKNNELSYQELFEMTLIKKIILLISRQEKKSIRKYLGIVGQFGSQNIRNYQYEKFDKYL
ncbi:MAG: hypothetical protein LBC27_07435 [Spirochaetaceae bacterium]|jgi:hypothetical protein|nr:hypothetical protein [Spirochaetaceae bacterium]